MLFPISALAPDRDFSASIYKVALVTEVVNSHLLEVTLLRKSAPRNDYCWLVMVVVAEDSLVLVTRDLSLISRHLHASSLDC